MRAPFLIYLQPSNLKKTSDCKIYDAFMSVIIYGEIQFGYPATINMWNKKLDHFGENVLGNVSKQIP